MSKSKTSFQFEEEIIELLKKLAKKNDRSQAQQIASLIREAAKKEKIK